MEIWMELGIFGLVFVFAFWQMHDVRKAQEHTRQQRAREKASQDVTIETLETVPNERTEHAPNPGGRAAEKKDSDA